MCKARCEKDRKKDCQEDSKEEIVVAVNSK